MTATTPRPLGGAHTGASHPKRVSLLRLRDGAAAVAGALATPLVPADYLDLIKPMRSGADLRGRIVSITAETADAATITIRPGRGWRPHVPGQYIRLGIDIDGVRHWRAYSLTSPVTGGGGDALITITTKAIPDGLVSHHLVHSARPGAMVMLDQATGEFTLPPTAPEKIFFLTAGSGVTPVMGILRNRLSTLKDVIHLHVAPTSDAVIFADELRSYAGNYTLIERHDDTHGILDLADVGTLVPDWRERQAWVCGPTSLLDAAETLWDENGLGESLHVERFRPSIIEAGEGGTITFLGSGVDVDADGSTPILDAGESAGVLMPSGCRMGICFGCVVTMREGSVRDLRTGELTVAEDGDPATIQTCINAAAGQCQLDL
ncbi:MAG: ferredoxin reductase [Nostocoides sp.]